jgi:hypothetical protein
MVFFGGFGHFDSKKDKEVPVGLGVAIGINCDGQICSAMI